jgi:O-antigen/teichoic acid export membrane protein
MNHGTKSAFFAYVATQGAAMAGQLISIPIYLSAVSTVEYGMWLLTLGALTASPLVELGVSGVLGNRIIHCASRNQLYKIGGYLAIARLLLLASTIVAAALTAACMLAFTSIFSPTLTEAQSRIFIFLIGFYAIGLLIFNSVTNLLRGLGSNAQSAWISSAATASEAISPAIGAMVTKSILGAAMAIAVSRWFFILMLYIYKSRAANARGHELKQSISLDRRLIIAVLRKSLLSLIPSLANSGMMQTPLIALSHSIGGTSAVALFSTLRTLFRVPFQLAFAYARASSNEYAAAVAGRDASSIARVTNRLALSVWFVAGGLSIGLWFGGPFILQLWTHGKLSASLVYFMAFAFYAGMHTYWQIASNQLIAINQHFRCIRPVLVSLLLLASIMTVVQATGEKPMMLTVLACVLLVEALLCLLITRQLIMLRLPTPSLRRALTDINNRLGAST